MSQLWISTLLIFLGLNMSIYFLGGAMAAYNPAFVTAYNKSGELIANVTSSGTGSGSGLWEYLVQQFLNPIILGSIAVASVIGRYVMGSNNFAILAAFSAAMVGWFLNPLSAVNSMGLPAPFGVLLLMIMEALVFITLVDFVRG